MRFVGLIVVVAIIYLAMSRHATQSSSSREVKEAIALVDSSLPPKQGATPAPVQGGGPAQSDYRAAMDRARSV
ncbi:MAG TPA: hypothetical protein VGH90_13640, partial [Chthoniobacteraceae bacterium]